MKRLFAHALGLAVLAAVLGCTLAFAQGDMRIDRQESGGRVDIGYFYDSLSPSGEWVDVGTYGWCWTPYDMTAGWRPYSDGHWEYTDYGWSWVSNESWGWATYHYGRWLFDDTYGWVWVPGTEWAPAWVAWRYGDDCVGWAPLPPGAEWDVSVGLHFGDADRIPSHEWCFVPRSHMLDANVRAQVTSVARNPTMISRSRDATRFEVRNGRPANVGLDVDRAGQFVGHRVPLVKIIDVRSPDMGGGRPVHGGIGFYRPAVQPVPARQAPPSAMRRAPLPVPFVQRQQAAQQRRLESDLGNEQKRLARDQDRELKSHAGGPAVDAIRNQHAAEQQAFQAHAAQQRQVLEQRMQKQVVKPAKRNGRPAQPDRGKPDPGDRGNGRDKGGK